MNLSLEMKNDFWTDAAHSETIRQIENCVLFVLWHGADLTHPYCFGVVDIFFTGVFNLTMPE